MIQALYPTLVFVALTCFVLTTLLARFVSPQTARLALGLGTGVCGLIVGLLVGIMERLPLFGAYEALTYTAFVVGFLELWAGSSHQGLKRQTLLTGIMTSLLLFPLVFRSDVMPRPSFFLYSHPLVACFFFCRLTALGFFAHAGIAYLAGAIPSDNPNIRLTSETRGRNFLLLGTVVFLLSEFAGSLWCYAGWGDSWRWSGNFFRSTMFFLLIMLGLHLPARWKTQPRMTCCIGSFACLFIVVCVLGRQLLE
ncbi:hypothetical protein [Desulfoplanes formicivorans]|uniref:Cytochrome c assembly protein domain-containing protein n=1 Tax=Desulfoplanes formicivorans TaxID=1592317 RepID=A0A194AB48_9BACT|nr:hypothetical protein [Desulfoplanes formicivorans]GAU07402.1 hypothetical protein DPF_0080 [Desulfoplanes formicivorans]